jgi:hypothetical protein
VDRFCRDGQRFYAKTYAYRWPLGPLRGVFRNTWLAPSRVAREDRALRHLTTHGVQPDLAVAAAERRILGFLVEARLLTRDFGGQDLAARLATGSVSASDLRGLGRFVRALHDTGLRDPDLHCRNILLRDAGADIEWAKIDASASVLVRPGRVFDWRRRRDLANLLADLERHGVGWRARLLLLAAQWFPGRVPRCRVRSMLGRADAARLVASPARR